ncbi:MAG: DUF1489 domain-containing protein [Pseudomonadota bacterium]
MTVHLIKLAAGATGLDSLSRWQDTVLERNKGTALEGYVHHVTRMTPKRADDLLDGGSLYWVINGLITVRQQIVRLDELRTDEGRKCCIVLEANRVLVAQVPRKAFQGWRYLDVSDAPPDLDAGEAHDHPIRAELAELGLL